ncbi:MAG: hypothetical protein ACRDD2_02190 [Sarcina sp.]
MKKKLLIILPIILTTLLLIFLGNFIVTKGFFNNNKGKLFYDDSKIIESVDNYSFLIRNGLSMNNETNLKFNFSGINSIWSLSANNENKLKITYNSKITSGEFKVLLITSEKKIIDILENDSEGIKDLILPKGENIIKIVGDNAIGEMQLKLEEENIKITSLAN